MEDKLTLEELEKALQEEFDKGEKADLKKVGELTAQIKEAYAADKEAAIKEASEGGIDEDTQAKLDEYESLKEENASLKAKAEDPNTARLMNINGGKSVTINETYEDEKGKKKTRTVEIQFSVPQFRFPKHGMIKVKDIYAYPERYSDVITKLYERNAGILVTTIKKGGK